MANQLEVCSFPSRVLSIEQVIVIVIVIAIVIVIVIVIVIAIVIAISIIYIISDWDGDIKFWWLDWNG